MNVLLFLASAVAVTSAGYPYAHGPIHVPVIGPHGVPVDTPEVQHARAAHLAALSEASARAGPYHGEVSGGGGGGGYDDGSYRGGDGDYSSGGGGGGGHAAYSGHRATPHAYPTTHGIAHVTHDGVPLNTPEVNAAAAHHFAAYNEAAARAGPYHGAHYRRRRSVYGAYHGPIHIPVIGHNGVPVDTPEVQHARAAHLAALAGHGGGAGYYAPAVVSGHWAHHGLPAIAHDGTPLDTAEVAHAKAAHFAAYNEAAARNGVHGHVGLSYAAPWGHYSNGAPADTPEVAHAKAAHFAAHAAARGHHY